MSTSARCSAPRRPQAARPLLAACTLSCVLGVVVASGGAAPAPGSPAAARPSPDYAAIFGARYADAERFLQTNAWIGPALQLPADDTRIALAVVFPELIRFSALEDEIQVRGLKVLYVQYGRSYTDFSVGRFQMKPSFAEQVEGDYARLFTRREREAIGIAAFERGDTPALRERRVRRLDDMEWQVRYLRLFMLVMGKRYHGGPARGLEGRLRFYATAYNAGYAAGAAVLRGRMGLRRFHVGRLAPAETYDYADVALHYFRGRPR